jgi:hypothetical protein
MKKFNNLNTTNLFYFKYLNFFKKTNNHNFFLNNKVINYSENYNDNEFFINRIKFKPGYKKLWRNSRNSIQELLFLKFKYQYKLTRYLLKFTKQSINYFSSWTEMSLWKVILFSKLLPDHKTIKLFFSKKYIYLNGLVVNNLNTYLIKNDLIQLIVSKWYYIIYRWFSNWIFNRLKKFKKLVYKKGLSSKYKLMKTFKQKSLYTPNWVYNSEFYNNDIKPYIEVDYFSLSTIIIYEPFFFLIIQFQMIFI